jgi:hypothetical protein
MENTEVEKQKTVVQEVAKAPAEVGKAVVDGAENVGHEVARVLVDGATVVVEAAKAAVSDIAKAGEQMSEDARHAFLPDTPELVTTSTVPASAPVAVAPVVATTAAVAPVVATTTPIAPIAVEPISDTPVILKPVA